MRISEQQVQLAFDTLQGMAHAKARAAYEYSEKRLKRVLAIEAHQSNAKTVSERDNEALRSSAYENALEDFRLIASAYYEARDQREASVAIIDAWRTQQSDQRALGRAG